MGLLSRSKKIHDDKPYAIALLAVADQSKIEELTREVREHNNFAKRVPVLEEKIKVANNRISDLENAVKTVGR